MSAQLIIQTAGGLAVPVLTALVCAAKRTRPSFDTAIVLVSANLACLAAGGLAGAKVAGRLDANRPVAATAHAAAVASPSPAGA